MKMFFIAASVSTAATIMLALSISALISSPANFGYWASTLFGVAAVFRLPGLWALQKG